MGDCSVKDGTLSCNGFNFCLTSLLVFLFLGDCIVMEMGIVNDWIALERITLLGGTIDL